MAGVRSHSEFNKRLGNFLTNGTAPCPDCGMDMPAGDHDLRMAHYAVCGGKRVDGNALTSVESDELAAREQVIERGFKVWQEVGEALLHIRDKRLYRAKYATFEDYCRDRWQMAKTSANRLINASEVYANLTPIGVILPANESQARELTTLAPEEQQLVWQVLTDVTDGNLTATTVKDAVNLFKEIKATGAVDDGDGGQIPLEQASSDHLKLALSDAAYERHQRQKAYIAEKQALKAAKRAAKQIAHSATDKPLSGNLYRLIQADFRQADIADESIDCIITDPPYPREFLHLYGDLAEFAARVLKPGGSLLTMCGQSYLPDVFSLTLPHLRYHWTISYLTPGGQSAQLWQRSINTFWKPLLWLTKGTYEGDWQGDVIRSGGNEKSHHDWQQSVSGMVDLVHRFTLPDQLILDPFCGSGTTGVACVVQQRRFIGIDQDGKAVAAAAERIAGCLTNPA